MDQIAPTNGLELPVPEKTPQSFEGLEINALPVEKVDSKPQADRLLMANDAINQASYGTPLQNVSGIAQDDARQTAPSLSSSSSLIADDVDVIEKAWVQKAKAIVDNTKEDPHRQSVELSHVKYDYIKKRYDKEIKLPDDQAA